MWHTLHIAHGITVSRNEVKLMKELDPEGCDLRRRRKLRRREYTTPGPNFACHVDGYDNLKDYGFPPFMEQYMALVKKFCGFV